MAKQALHIALSLILYVSTAGISIHSHYCKNELKAVSFLVEASSCHTAKKSCPHHPPAQEDKKDCCDNQLSFEKLDTELFSVTTDIVPDYDFVSIMPFVESDGPEYKGIDQIAVHKYRPPPGKTPKYILYRSILC